MLIKETDKSIDFEDNTVVVMWVRTLLAFAIMVPTQNHVVEWNPWTLRFCLQSFEYRHVHGINTTDGRSSILRCLRN